MEILPLVITGVTAIVHPRKPVGVSKNPVVPQVDRRIIGAQGSNKWPLSVITCPVYGAVLDTSIHGR